MHLDSDTYIALGYLGAVLLVTVGVFGFLLVKRFRRR